MYQLTIDHGGSSSRTSHAQRADAHAALLRYVVHADYYLGLIQSTPQHTSYDLIELSDVEGCTIGGRARCAGRAVIEPLTGIGDHAHIAHTRISRTPRTSRRSA